MRNQLIERPVAVKHNIRELRIAAGFSQQTAAERFDLSLRVWQMKETGKNPTPLSQGKYELLLLLAGEHPNFALLSQKKK
jgi:DNA-binding XRE family transcriptional regulator